MNTVLEGDALVAQWRASADADSPAGPLFIGGRYAKADIVDSGESITTNFLCTCGTRIHDNCCN
ncbi:DUF6229 family protein [Dyella silvatica]|uniref:DUF6229 family protein n=1 Tax=Dyella silvatica TaxID=2992128 RepID=UPI0022546A3D|nr:DUF6229 family protein [Dyella silvatica]